MKTLELTKETIEKDEQRNDEEKPNKKHKKTKRRKKIWTLMDTLLRALALE